MKRFLFRFGFESPAEYASNERDGTDFESSWCIAIRASTSDDALVWGQQIAEMFVQQLFMKANLPAPSWLQSEFSHSIHEADETPSSEEIPSVDVGDMPDFSAALARWLS